MKFAMISVAVATLLCVPAAVAEEAAPAAPVAEAPPPAAVSKRDPNERVCKVKPVIGSRVPTRTCKTRAEWEAQSKADKEMLDDSLRRGLSSCGTNPCGG